MKRIYPFVVFFILLPFLFGCEGKGDGVLGLDEKPIKIGFMICNSRAESKARFEPIAAYLSEKHLKNLFGIKRLTLHIQIPC
jgi:hypothetical protein